MKISVIFLFFLFLRVKGSTTVKRDIIRWPNLINEDSLPSMHLLKFKNKYYYIGDIFKGNYFQCEQFCRYHGMTLVSIESEEENTFIYNFLNARGVNNITTYFTSASRILESNQFMWLSNGRVMNYSNWYKGEPNNVKGEENCVGIYYIKGDTMRWNDYRCEFHKLFFICEFAIPPPCQKYFDSFCIQNNGNCSLNEDIAFIAK